MRKTNEASEIATGGAYPPSTTTTFTSLKTSNNLPLYNQLENQRNSSNG